MSKLIILSIILFSFGAMAELPTPTIDPEPTPTPAPGTGYCVTESRQIGPNDYLITAVDCSNPENGCPAVVFECNRSFQVNPSCECPCQGVEIDCPQIGMMEAMNRKINSIDKKLKKRIKKLERKLQ